MLQENTPTVKIEDVINNALEGNTKENLLEFVAFLRANDFQMEYNPNEYHENFWSGAIGGVVGDSIGYMAINGNPGPWVVWFNAYDFYESDPLDDEMKQTIWAKVSYCGKCNDNWENCYIGEKTILGKTFEKLCHSH